MPLTAAEVVDVRRFAGYGVLGSATSDVVAAAIATMTTEEEAIIRDPLLPALRNMEKALIDATSTVDTASAAVWTRNAAALAELSMLYRNQRLMLCRFMNIEPGVGVYDPLLVITDPTAVEGGGVGDLAQPPAVFVI